MKPRPFTLLTLLLTAAGPALAQPSFQEMTPTADPHFVTPADEDFGVSWVAPADVDGDADLDYLVAGAYFVPGGNGLVESQMHLYRDGAAAANAAPGAPAPWSGTPRR